MTLTITPLYAAASALILLALIYHVIFARAKYDISLGEAGNADLLTRVRRHGNFTETVPLALIVMGFAELGGASATWLHVAGLLLVGSRLIQPFGLNAETAARPARILGGLGTHLSILLSTGLIGLNALG